MDIYVARQPIFDREMNLYGYELLYRQGEANRYVEVDDDIATTELMANSFLVMGLLRLTDGKKAFINFSKDLIQSEVPFMLPSQNVVIEILERGQTTREVLEACTKIRTHGYQVALDDVVTDENFAPLLSMVDIVKVEYPSVSLADQIELIRKCIKRPGLKLLAEKIETREEFRRAVDLGYDYFQGYFFSRPTMVKAKEIVALQSSLLAIVEELHQPEPSYQVIAKAFEGDLGLSYKLLTLANSAYMGAKCQIRSIPQALSYIGTRELYQWISIMMIKDTQNAENSEMVKLSRVRGKLMELLSRELALPESASEYFLTGMFSFIDVLLNRSMGEILNGLPFSDDVRMALLGQQNNLNLVLKAVENAEAARWDEAETRPVLERVGTRRFMELYMQALEWARRFDA